MPDPLLVARGIEAGYANRQILRGVDLDVAEGNRGDHRLEEQQRGREPTCGPRQRPIRPRPSEYPDRLALPPALDDRKAEHTRVERLRSLEVVDLEDELANARGRNAGHG